MQVRSLRQIYELKCLLHPDGGVHLFNQFSLVEALETRSVGNIMKKYLAADASSVSGDGAVSMLQSSFDCAKISMS